MTIRVLLADDQELVRSGFRSILRHAADLEVVAEAANGAEAVRLARDRSVDVVVIDIRMPGMDGIEATRALCHGSRSGAPHVLIVTTYSDDEYVFESLRAGAQRLPAQGRPAEELINGIRLVAAGNALLSPAVTREVIEHFTSKSARPLAIAPHEELTPRERDVLALIAGGLSNLEIAEALTVSEPTVKTHVAHILAKLTLRNRLQAVVYAYEHQLTHPTTEGTPTRSL